jgi:ribose transport system substrate-binding protein
VLSYLPESGPTTRREKGFVNAIAKDFEGIEIVDSECGDDTVEAASKAAENLLGRHPQVDGLFACNESTSLGALQALQRRQLPGKIKMVGFGVEKPLIDGLRAGEIDCLVVRNGYRIGYEAVRAVIAANRGEQPKRHIDVKAVPVTRANLDTPEIRRLLEAGSR